MAHIRRETFNNVIRIDCPPGTNNYNPLCVTLDGNNCITASGGTDDLNVITFTSIQGQLVGISTITQSFPGGPPGLNWSIPKIGPLVPGQVYKLLVTAQVQFIGESGTVQCTNYKFFIAVNASYPCPSGHSPSAEAMLASVLPRYFRLRLQEELPGAAAPAGGVRLGGLLEPSSVYLAYDTRASTLATPVWRDINLPDYIGGWTLRVTQTCSGQKAELVQQTLGPREVLAPMVFRCDGWSFQRANVLVLARAAHGGAGAAPLTVVVEPA